MPDERTMMMTTLFGAALLALPAAAWIAYYCRFAGTDNKQKSNKSSLSSARLGNTHTCCGNHQDLKNHSRIFKKQVIRLQGTDDDDDINVFVAIGYSLANCIMIEGDDGIIIIDTTESITSAKEVLVEFRKITDKPVKGIILTHFHHDHVAGSEAFVKEAAGACPIWAHETTGQHISHFNAIMGPLAYVRAAKMYGTYLERPLFENCGIGPFLAGVVDDEQALEDKMNVNLPTHTYSTSHQRIAIAGVVLDLIHAPGETDDQTVVYLPKHKILFAADNYYESFPNLYTIRGAPNRDVLQWAASIDTMIQTHPNILVPSHTLPVYGAQEIETRLVNYRDAIQYVHDQTVRLMLNNHHPDEIAVMIQLPCNLRSCEYLKQFYGTVGWSAKAIFHAYMGWYSGDECDLNRLTPSEYAHRLIDLAGGNPRAVLDKAQQAYDKADYQWALELTTAILRTSKSNSHPRQQVTAAARKLKTLCCAQLGEQQMSANGRNWYMTSALVNNGDVDIKLPKKHRDNALLTFPLDQIISSLAVRFCPKEALVNVTTSMCFVLKDGSQEEGWTLTIRNSVLYCKKEIQRDANIVIETTEPALRQLFSNPASIATSILSSNFSVKKGDIKTLLQFVGNFDFGL